MTVAQGLGTILYGGSSRVAVDEAKEGSYQSLQALV